MTELFGHQWLKIRLLITHWGSPDHDDFDYLYIRYEWKNRNFTFLFPLIIDSNGTFLLGNYFEN